MVSILHDIDFIITPGGADDGTFTAGTPITVRMDTVTIDQNNQLVNVSTSQDRTPLNRAGQEDWTITCQTKLARDAGDLKSFENTVVANLLIGFSTMERAGATGQFLLPSGRGIVESVNLNYSGEAGTLSIVIRPYGEPLVLTQSTL